MTRNDTELLLKYMISMYPNVKMSEQQFSAMVTIWANELSNESKESVVSAFRSARLSNPDWMPTLPKILETISLSSMSKRKSPEIEFKDSHCGKSQDEWEKMVDWENSPDGMEKLKSYKEAFKKLIDM